MLQQWEAKWLMSFNPGKCEVLRVTNKRKHIIHTHYKIHGMILDTVDKTKYLGVTIQSKLKGALYRIWCGVNRLGDSGVKVV